MFGKLQAASGVALIALFGAAGGCARSAMKTGTSQERANQTQTAAATADIVLLQGTVIRKSWTRTLESWNAGGSHYYVLDTDRAAVPRRSAGQSVILRPSGQVPFGAFEQFKGRRVAVEGRFVEGRPWTSPPGSIEPHPVPLVDPLTRARMRRGSGFQVLRITQLNKPR